MLSCAVYGCTNNSITSDSSITYYPFPKNAHAQQWADACGWQSSSIDLNTAYICSVHFDETAFISEIQMVGFDACYLKSLRDDAIPSLYLPQTQILVKSNPCNLVVYTIDSSDTNNAVATISLDDEGEEEEILELQPSTSAVKIEDQIPEEDVNENEKYHSIKSYPDLFVLQAQNKSLKRRVDELEQEVGDLRKQLAECESEYAKNNNECKVLSGHMTSKDVFSLQDQKNLLSKVFSEAQIKILLGKKKIFWSNDDMAVGFIIRHLSNKRCYSYLTKNMHFPLPGISSVKRWIYSKKGKKVRR